MPRLNVFAIRRGHCREAGVFFVRVPDAAQRGIGFMFPVGPWVIGFSLIAQKTYSVPGGRDV